MVPGEYWLADTGGRRGQMPNALRIGLPGRFRCGPPVHTVHLELAAPLPAASDGPRPCTDPRDSIRQAQACLSREAVRVVTAKSRWRELPNMISSQDGTEDRLPRAALRPCRAACSPAASAGAGRELLRRPPEPSDRSRRPAASGRSSPRVGESCGSSEDACRRRCGTSLRSRPGGPVGPRATCAATAAGLTGGSARDRRARGGRSLGLAGLAEPAAAARLARPGVR